MFPSQRTTIAVTPINLYSLNESQIKLVLYYFWKHPYTYEIYIDDEDVIYNNNVFIIELKKPIPKLYSILRSYRCFFCDECYESGLFKRKFCCNNCIDLLMSDYNTKNHKEPIDTLFVTELINPDILINSDILKNRDILTDDRISTYINKFRHYKWVLLYCAIYDKLSIFYGCPTDVLRIIIKYVSLYRYEKLIDSSTEYRGYLYDITDLYSQPRILNDWSSDCGIDNMGISQLTNLTNLDDANPTTPATIKNDSSKQDDDMIWVD